MRMPGMDGATFLAKVKDVSPDTVRILLTGQTDLETAMAAVNQGHVSRFLNKPCPTTTLLGSVHHAVQYHHLLTPSEGHPLSAENTEALARVPALTDRLLANVPRFEIVRGMLAGMSEPYRVVDADDSGGEAALIVRGAQMLKVASDFDALETVHWSSAKALEVMVEHDDAYDPEVLILLPMLLDKESTHEQASRTRFDADPTQRPTRAGYLMRPGSRETPRVLTKFCAN
jgi:response regulator RpfG family c-di-GMP phosphodiesterase